jgi:hypothetical protein
MSFLLVEFNSGTEERRWHAGKFRPEEIQPGRSRRLEARPDRVSLVQFGVIGRSIPP